MKPGITAIIAAIALALTVKDSHCGGLEDLGGESNKVPNDYDYQYKDVVVEKKNKLKENFRPISDTTDTVLPDDMIDIVTDDNDNYSDEDDSFDLGMSADVKGYKRHKFRNENVDGDMMKRFICPYAGKFRDPYSCKRYFECRYMKGSRDLAAYHYNCGQHMWYSNYYRKCVNFLPSICTKHEAPKSRFY